MDDGRRTTHDDGRQPIAIGHLSDSGDLKITSMTFKITNHLQNHCANFAQILHKTSVDDVD